MTQLINKVIWITGASSGIGEALAKLAAQRGARLVLSSRREARPRLTQRRNTVNAARAAEHGEPRRCFETP